MQLSFHLCSTKTSPWLQFQPQWLILDWIRWLQVAQSRKSGYLLSCNPWGLENSFFNRVWAQEKFALLSRHGLGFHDHWSSPHDTYLTILKKHLLSQGAWEKCLNRCWRHSILYPHNRAIYICYHSIKLLTLNHCDPSETKQHKPKTSNAILIPY